jgi:hypothetical protein
MKTAAQRMEFGKSRRRAFSRNAQGELHPKHRKFDALQVLIPRPPAGGMIWWP